MAQLNKGILFVLCISILAIGTIGYPIGSKRGDPCIVDAKGTKGKIVYNQTLQQDECKRAPAGHFINEQTDMIEIEKCSGPTHTNCEENIFDKCYNFTESCKGAKSSTANMATLPTTMTNSTPPSETPSAAKTSSNVTVTTGMETPATPRDVGSQTTEMVNTTVEGQKEQKENTAAAKTSSNVTAMETPATPRDVGSQTSGMVNTTVEGQKEQKENTTWGIILLSSLIIIPFLGGFFVKKICTTSK